MFLCFHLQVKLLVCLCLPWPIMRSTYHPLDLYERSFNLQTTHIWWWSKWKLESKPCTLRKVPGPSLDQKDPDVYRSLLSLALTIAASVFAVGLDKQLTITRWLYWMSKALWTCNILVGKNYCLDCMTEPFLSVTTFTDTVNYNRRRIRACFVAVWSLMCRLIMLSVYKIIIQAICTVAALFLSNTKRQKSQRAIYCTNLLGISLQIKAWSNQSMKTKLTES